MYHKKCIIIYRDNKKKGFSDTNINSTEVHIEYILTNSFNILYLLYTRTNNI